MTKTALPLLAALLCGVAMPVPASAQGTPEEREACAPDAVRLCPDTIPDVDRTKACMKTHEAQLSARCHKLFAAETGETRAVEPKAAQRAPDTGAASPEAPSKRRTRHARQEEEDTTAPDAGTSRRVHRRPPVDTVERDDGDDRRMRRPPDERAERDYGDDRRMRRPPEDYPPGPDAEDEPGPGRRYPPGPGYGYDRDMRGPPPPYGYPPGPEYVMPGEREYLYMSPNGRDMAGPPGGPDEDMPSYRRERRVPPPDYDEGPDDGPPPYPPPR